MTRTVTPQEAAALSHGCAPLLGTPDRAVIMVGRTLREVCRVHVWRQDWLTADGHGISHMEVRVPAMGAVFVVEGGSLEGWEAIRAQIHAWMERQIGYTCPLMASNHQNGGWFNEAEFVVGERDIPHLRFAHPADFGVLVRKAWAGFVSEPAGAQDIGEARLADAADGAFDVAPLVIAAGFPFEEAEADGAGLDLATVEDVGQRVGDDEQTAVEFGGAVHDVARSEAVGRAKGIGRGIALGPDLDFFPNLSAVGQLGLFDAGSERDVERAAKGAAHAVGPADGESIRAKFHRGRSPPAVALDNGGRLA